MHHTMHVLDASGGDNKIIYQDILTALADATNDLYMPCHELRTGIASALILFSRWLLLA